MTHRAEQIKLELNHLSENDQAELASYLLRRLGPPSVEDDALDATLRRRIDQIMSGRAEGIAAEELHQRLREKYS